jgi:hypothetical protein
VNIKIAGKWMFIPLKMVLIGIYPYTYRIYRYPQVNGLNGDVPKFDQRLGLLRLCRCLQLDLGAFAAADSQQLWSQHLWPAPQAPGRHGASARRASSALTRGGSGQKAEDFSRFDQENVKKAIRYMIFRQPIYGN